MPFDFTALDLPITQIIEPLRQQLNQHDEAILEAEPGAGKTTLVPLALLDQPWLKQQKILVLEPRRLAAKHAAARMAELLKEPLGKTVGYRIRHEQKVSQDTRIEVITEGILVRLLQDDPSLEGIGLIIFDEFHERNLDSDLALALCLESRDFLREEEPLKLLIMSATLEQASLEKALGCRRLFCPGRSFPVSVNYQNLNLKQDEILPHLSRTVCHALSHDEGHILVFLPGQSEINRLESSLQDQLADHCEVLPLYGKLDFKAQQAVLALNKHSDDASNKANKRRVILATAIAQTSLTIPSVKVVIDSGLSREARFDANTGLTRLHTRKASQAESIQRTGRAGRTSEGVCYRWWSEDAQSRFMEQAPPQIITADLSNLALELAKWGASHHQGLTWLTPVPEGHWQQAVGLLQHLGALEKQDNLKLTALGEAMSQFSASARIGRLILAGIAIKESKLSTLLGALIMEGNSGQTQQMDLSEQALGFHTKTNQKVTKTQQQLLQQMNKLAQGLVKKIELTSSHLTASDLAAFTQEDKISYLLACAYPDRIAKQQALDNSSQWQDFKLANGRLAQLHKSHAVAKAGFIIALETGGNSKFNKDQIFLASPLNPHLFEDALHELTRVVEKVSWPKNSERLLSSQDTMIGGLSISSKKLSQVSEEAQTQTVCQHIRSLGLHLLNWDKAALRVRHRLAFIQQMTESDQPNLPAQMTQFQWPKVDDASLLDSLEKWLAPYLANVSTHAKLSQLSLADILLNQLEWSQQQALVKLAPESLKVASGNQIRLDYQAFPPSLKVKLQEMFGTLKTPEIAGTKVKIELLSPAQKPLAITQDLEHFWQNAYHEVKKEMRGRYPKHPWPDNPLEAIASAKTKKALSRDS